MHLVVRFRRFTTLHLQQIGEEKNKRGTGER